MPTKIVRRNPRIQRPSGVTTIKPIAPNNKGDTRPDRIVIGYPYFQEHPP